MEMEPIYRCYRCGHKHGANNDETLCKKCLKEAREELGGYEPLGRKAAIKAFLWDLMDDEPFLNEEELVDAVVEEFNYPKAYPWLRKLIETTNYRDADKGL